MLGVFIFLTIFGQVVNQILPVFVSQRTMYESRERPSKTYSWKAFLGANILVEIVWNSVSALPNLFFILPASLAELCVFFLASFVGPVCYLTNRFSLCLSFASSAGTFQLGSTATPAGPTQNTREVPMSSCMCGRSLSSQVLSPI